jgi:hypothetical protein
MKPQTALAIWILLAGTALAQAQTGIWMGVGPAPRSGVAKDAPFSADVTSTNDRTDSQPGLNSELHGKAARNSQGSSYFAMEPVAAAASATPSVRVVINDPAAGTVTTLDAHNKLAFVSHVNGARMAPSSALVPGAVASSAGSPMTVASTTGAPIASPGATTENLGTKTIDGLQVIGQRITRTVNPGGPDSKPFVSTLETWTSPELKVVVLTETRTSNGDRHITKLTNIVRTEPNAGLFQVPAGYSVRDNAPRSSNVQ